MTQKINIAILGASGYTGAELIRWLLNHPQANIAALSGDSKAGQRISEVYPHFQGHDLPLLQKIAEIDFNMIDCVFCCLPHGTTQEVISNLPEHIKIIDLSADFRLRDIALYQEWYQKPHAAPALQKQVVYGLVEHYREEIKNARIVANPGCYPTASQLPLFPLLEQKRIKAENIVIDAKSGVTGAGRKASQNLLYTELNEGFSAYGVGKHRHTPEIEQGLSHAAGTEIQVRFTPHLVPMNRGILATIYVDLNGDNTANHLRQSLQDFYQTHPFVQILAEGQTVSTAHVRGTNLCQIAVFEERIAGKAILVSAIDNLAKGASSQALQNMNLMFGLPENTALAATAIFP